MTKDELIEQIKVWKGQDSGNRAAIVVLIDNKNCEEGESLNLVTGSHLHLMSALIVAIQDKDCALSKVIRTVIAYMRFKHNTEI